MDDIIQIIESTENSGLLVDRGAKAVKYEIKKQEGRVLPAMVAPMAASLIDFFAS